MPALGRLAPMGHCTDYARLGHSGEGWQTTGCDPEGLDIRSGAAVARLEFATPVTIADGVPAALAQLAGTPGAPGGADVER